MITVTRDGDDVITREYFRLFSRTDIAGAGFSFPCKADGTIELEGLQPEALANVFLCTSGHAKHIVDQGVEVREDREPIEAEEHSMNARDHGDLNVMRRTQAAIRRDLGSSFILIWPERRIVSADTITGWYNDAVANGDAEAGFTEPGEMARELDSIGFISLGR